jgi:ketosteroid isomerase-like protein
MKKLALLALLGALAFSPAFAQTTEGQISQLERRRFEAQVKKDAAFLNEVLADNLLYTHSNGKVDTKASFIAAVESGTSSYKDVVLEEETVKVTGTTAVVSGVVRLQSIRDGNWIPLHLRYTDVYVKQKGKWQMVAWQSLRLAE